MRRVTSLIERRRDAAAGSLPFLTAWTPILVIGIGATAVSAVTAWIGWHRAEMLIATATVAASALALATFLLYRQETERRTARRVLHDVEVRVSDVLNSAMDAIITVD